jgi:hypothetical protein
MRAVPDDNDDPATDVAKLIANATAQHAEMTAGEDEFLRDLEQHRKAR